MPDAFGLLNCTSTFNQALRVEAAIDPRSSPGQSAPLALSRARSQSSIEATHRDAYSVLPMEIRHMILEYLLNSDVLALRQVFRGFASLGLPDLFWRSRFLPGRELGFVFEAMPYFSSLPGRWKTLHDSLKLTTELLSSSLTTRKRILDLSARLQRLLHRAASTRCRGESNNSFIEMHRPMSWTSGSWFRDKPRSLHDRRVLVPDDMTAIFISTVDVYGHQYVSGIRMEQGHIGGNSIILGY
ncbi:hypothetical protein N658DRAFT_202706 [Parathielavia hyrcaniae]|uniref:F-box domain-containing protein n=1 Tax=Parathielavia hyrcaniae TaxID=113614 RepID=A0AAN6PYI3_9PEZI|nr:hypothetical protein N658DRAFT_202706 [Parathielavia hyrcaniae]